MSLLSFVHPFRFIGKVGYTTIPSFFIDWDSDGFSFSVWGKTRGVERASRQMTSQRMIYYVFTAPALNFPPRLILLFVFRHHHFLLVKIYTNGLLCSFSTRLSCWLRAEKSLFCLLLPNIGIYWNLLIMNNDIILHHFRLNSKLTFRRWLGLLQNYFSLAAHKLIMARKPFSSNMIQCEKGSPAAWLCPNKSSIYPFFVFNF